MPLFQFIGSIIAVAIVAWIASRLFHNPNKLTVDRVIRNTARYCPHLNLEANSEVFISEAGDSAAVVLLGDHKGIALLTALGDRVVVREITETTKVKTMKTKTGVAFDIDDFTQPKIEMQLQEDACNSLLNAFQRLTKSHSEPVHA